MTQREEKTIYTFLESEYKNRYQLVEVNDTLIGTDGIETSLCCTKYQIRKNRRILCTMINYKDAKRKFYLITGSEILQTKLFY